ncbi:unnamed protein product [Prunus armeniaca]
MVGDYALLPQLFPNLEEVDLEGLSCPISIEEIKNSVLAIGRLKTPGPDGFPTLFYQDYWGVCSDDIISFVQDCFNTAFLPNHLNETLIALVPKVERPMFMNQLRPISLCNTLYKVVSKILVARLRPCMTKRVSPSQYKAILNWELTNTFSPQCGIRQGDPLSPYIFLLCKEKLSHLIQQKIQDRAWKSVQICQGGPHISHLFFADDLILFGEATTDQAWLMKQCLDDLCQLSGQRVSFEKSMICVSSNTGFELANSIAAISGSPLTASLGKYLGVPLIHTRVTKQTYQEVIAKVQKRLASWKSHTLSMAGRITLLQSVTAAIPIYTMQTAKFPMSVCDKLDQLNRNFLLGHTSNTSKIHLVNWEQVCKPKVASGLGIKRSAWMNQALLAKTGWRLLQHEQGLWSQVFYAKYLKHQNILAVKDSYFPCSSSVWRGVLYGNSALSKVGLIDTFGSSFLPAEASVKWDWQFLWRLRLPPKLLTNVQRQKRGLTQVPICPRCDYPTETIAHLFKDCPFSLAIWNCLQIGDNSSPVMMDFKEWLLRNLHSKRKYALEWFNATKPTSPSYMPSVVQLHWIAPTYGVCKINTDGSRNSDSGFIGAGSLLRDNYGAWIKGFSVNLGVGSVLEAEMWGIFWGLHLAWESASFCGGGNCCKLKVQAGRRCSVKHIFREQNVAADVLASKSSEFGPGVQYFTEVPAFLLTCLAEDAIGVSRSRVVCA